MLRLRKTRRAVVLTAASLALASGATIGTAGNAFADSYTKVENEGAWCLNGHGWGNQVTMGGCWYGPNNAPINWRWVPITGIDAHGGRWWQVIDPTNNLCLDADTNTIGTEGSKVQEWGCNGYKQQWWYAWPQGGTQYEIINGLNTNFVLDCINGWNAGNPAYLWTANYTLQQEWFVGGLY